MAPDHMTLWRAGAGSGPRRTMPDEDRPTVPPTPGAGLGVGALAAVFLGGALGTLARYALDTAYATTPGHFPATTLFINLSGSLVIGMAIPFTGLLPSRFSWARPFAVVGVLGGWTTYSTLAVDAALLGK